MHNQIYCGALSELRQSDPAVYQLRIRGDLDDSWSDYMNAIWVSNASDADTPLPTTLICAVTDQAQLVGMLHMLQSWGIVLIRLECMAVAKSAMADFANRVAHEWGTRQSS
jgi:hypothetical protein